MVASRAPSLSARDRVRGPHAAGGQQGAGADRAVSRDRGGSERNAVISALVGRPATFVAVKAAMTTGTLVAADHLSKRSRAAADVLMISANSACAIVVAYNYQLASRLR